jgi:hypothetical protein
MKKLKLALDDLAVDSFQTAPVQELRGTVRGHGDSTACSYGSPQYTACDFSCEFACGESGECTPTCPRTSGTGGTGGSVGATCYPDSGCDLSCEFAC